MHHVRVHLRSRLDSRYKSSGNVEGRHREGQRSNGGKDLVDCQQILDRCRVACVNVWTKCRSAETRTRTRESRTSPGGFASPHHDELTLTHVHTNARSELWHRDKIVFIGHKRIRYRPRCERDLDMKISKHKMQRDYLCERHIILGHALLKMRHTY